MRIRTKKLIALLAPYNADYHARVHNLDKLNREFQKRALRFEIIQRCDNWSDFYQKGNLYIPSPIDERQVKMPKLSLAQIMKRTFHIYRQGNGKLIVRQVFKNK